MDSTSFTAFMAPASRSFFHLKLGKADVMGYSLGASVALQTAIRRPNVVDRLVLAAGRMRQDGAYPEVVAAFNQLEANAEMIGPGVKASPLGPAYPEVDWVNLFRKLGGATHYTLAVDPMLAEIIERFLGTN